MRGPALSIAAAIVLSACGGEGDRANLHLGFQQHELVCEIKDIRAKMQITDVPGYCELEVNEDRTVGGLCPKIPTGEARAFRLIYFIEKLFEGELTEVQLATVIETLDLTSETRSLVTLEFSSDDVVTDFDDDNDRMSNIVEVCTGRDPLVIDQ